jgi:hypothetical protein
MFRLVKTAGWDTRPYLFRPYIVLLLALTLAGCAARAKSVADIRNDPGQFDNRQVEVTGRVTSAWSVPLVPYGLYKIDDGSAEITVLSQQRGTPSKGALVKVRGRVREVASFGSGSVGLHIEERHRDLVRR